MILIKRRGFGGRLNWRKMSNIALVCTFWHNWLNPLPEIWQRPLAWRWRLMLLFFSTCQHCPPSKMYFRYLYPLSNIFVFLHFSIAISTLPFFKIGFKYLYQPVYIFFLSDTYIDLKNTVKHYPPQNIFLHPSTTQHCPPAELRLVQMTLVMTPNDLKTTLLHWRGTTSLVKLEHHT